MGLRRQVLKPHSLPPPKGRSRLGDALEELGIMFQAVVEPVFLGLEADEDARGLPMAGDHDFFALRQPQILREIIFDLRQGYFPLRERLLWRARLPLRLWR